MAHARLMYGERVSERVSTVGERERGREGCTCGEGREREGV